MCIVRPANAISYMPRPDEKEMSLRMNKVATISIFATARMPLAFTILLGVGQIHAQQTRSQVGSLFAYPNGQSWSNFGAYVGPPKSMDFSYMAPDALKVIHTRFHLFKESDDITWNW